VSLPPQTVRRAVSARAVSLGLAGVALISALTHYNDFTLNNTPLIGNYLPIGALLLSFAFLVFVNGPLSRFRPASAFGGGELCVAFSILLVGCAIPGSGLLRYLIPSFVLPWTMTRVVPEFAEVLGALKLPDWMFPSFPNPPNLDRSTWSTDPIVTGYEQRWNEPGPYPFLAFLRPLAVWGAFVAALMTTLLAMSLLVRRQWVDNERLPFPLAQVQLALIEPPAPGHWLNPTLSARSFWFAFATVFLIHFWNGLAAYTKDQVPPIPIDFDLQSLFTAPPLNYAEPSLYKARFYLTAAAVTFLLRPSVGLSLWLFFILQQSARMIMGTATGDPNLRGQADLHFGAFLGFVLMVLYTGRRHWLFCLRQAFLPTPEPDPMYLSIKSAARAFLLGVVGLVVFLWLVGCTLPGAAVIVAVLLMLFFGLMRIVAEVGLIHGQFQIPIGRPFALLAQMGFGKTTSAETYFHATLQQCILFDQRETLPVYATHALKLADTQLEQAPRRDGLKLVLCFALALLVAFVVGSVAQLANEYTFSASLDGTNSFPIDPWGGSGNWRWQMVEPNLTWSRGNFPIGHDPVPWFAAGTLAAVGLYAGRLFFPGFPLHPIGLLMVGSYPLITLWFSFMIGYFAKVLTVRFGGHDLYVRARPAIVGIVVGEAVVAGGWVLIAFILSLLGLPYARVLIMPP
jgi:hypothetical protein